MQDGVNGVLVPPEKVDLVALNRAWLQTAMGN